MKPHLVALSAAGLAACASAPAVDGLRAAVRAGWFAPVVDLAEEQVHARLGPPIRTEPNHAGQVSSCFAVSPPWLERCVTYLDGRVFDDRAVLEAPAGTFVTLFNDLSRAVSAHLGREPSEVERFVFTPGEHVLSSWDGRGFHFGESCVFQKASTTARAERPEGLSADAPELAAALSAGTVCLHASWGVGAVVRTGEAANPRRYGLRTYRTTTDPARLARQAEVDAESRARADERLREIQQRVDALEAGGESAPAPAGEAAP
jgi:hypothetical protein